MQLNLVNFSDTATYPEGLYLLYVAVPEEVVVPVLAACEDGEFWQVEDPSAEEAFRRGDITLIAGPLPSITERVVHHHNRNVYTIEGPYKSDKRLNTALSVALAVVIGLALATTLFHYL